MVFVRYLFLVAVFVSVASCVAMRDLPIETLEPAVLTFAGVRDSVAVSAVQTALSESVETGFGAANVPQDSLIADILFALRDLCVDAPGFQHTVFVMRVDAPGELPAAAGFDMTVLLEKLQMQNTYYSKEYSYFEWEAFLHVEYAATWSIRGKTGELIDEYTDRDVIVWPSGVFMDEAEAVAGLPAIKDAWREAGFALAQRYAARIAPQWHTAVRRIYMINRFPDLSMQAYTAMQNNAYARAVNVWETMLLSCRKGGHKGIKGQIMYNMAVACEFQNQLDEAVDFAQQSTVMKQMSRTAGYLSYLRERQQQMIQLDMQTSP